MNSNVLQLLDRVDSLEKLVCRLHEQLHQLQSPFHTPAQSTHANSCLLVNNATQTDTNDYDTTPMDLEILSEKIRQCQNQDKDIGTLKYFINRNIMPEAKEISNFQPRMRRYLWQLSRFVVQDDIVYRKRMNSDRVTATLQLVVPSNLVPDVLRTFHPPVGHVTLQRTLENTTKHMFWPFMQRDITNFSNTCNICHNARTGPETSLPHDQPPSSMIQKAVCAITELTKDFINCTSSRNDQPHAKHKSMRPRKRSRKNTQLRSQNAGIHHHSPPANNHPNLPPQKAQTHISPPRDQPHTLPPKDCRSHSPPREHLPPRDDNNYPMDSRGTSYSHDSPPRDFRDHLPPRDLRARSSEWNFRDHSPPRDFHDHSPLRELYDYSPPRDYRYNSPPRDFHYHASPREFQDHLPPPDHHSHTSIQRDFHYNPPLMDDRHSLPRDVF